MDNTETCNITLVGKTPSINHIVRNDLSLKVIAVTSGNGGSGKTSIAINLATALSHTYGKVLLIDANFGLSNIDVALGLHPKSNIRHVLSGKNSIDEIAIQGPADVQILPAAPYDPNLSSLNNKEYLELIHLISQYSTPTNYVVIDTPSGIGNDVTLINQSASHILVLINDNPSSLKRAVALIHILKRIHKKKMFLILSNKVRSKEHGEFLFNRLREKCIRYGLDEHLKYCGCIHRDENLENSLRSQKTIFENYSRCNSANDITKLAHSLSYISNPDSDGGIELFHEHRLQLDKVYKA